MISKVSLNNIDVIVYRVWTVESIGSELVKLR